ncbi:MAG: serine/threonine-protein kinase [Acidobacteriota bacterium]
MQRRLGAGAFGVVYEAYDRREQALVALKVLRQAEADALYRFKKGFRSLADLRHPNLVSFYELMNHEGMWFFSMELIPGRELTEALELGSGPVDFERVRKIILQLSLGLHEVHRHGLLHRDIKPPNVLVTPDDEVKLLDFGLVAELGPRRLASGEAAMVGTPAYMSPEQANGDSGHPRGDWYSVGVMLYQCLAGSLPFEGSLLEVLTRKQRGVAPGQLRGRVPDVPEDLERMCLGLLETDPEKRLTGPEVLATLERDDSRVDVHRFGLDDFVGRRAQLQELDDALTASRRGTVLVHVKGVSGIGKSALLDHFASQVEAVDESAVVLRGRCYVQEAVPYKALDSLVDALSRFLLSLPRHDAEVLLPTRIAALARLFPVLRRVPAVDAAPSTRDAGPADPQILRRRAFGALRELLARLAVRRTLVLIIDDLQWGDLDSFVLIDEILKSSEPLPVLFIGSYRSENETERRSSKFQNSDTPNTG